MHLNLLFINASLGKTKHMKRIALLLTIGVIFLSFNSNAQSRRWKRTRYEVTGGIGVTSVMGELGGGKESSRFISDFDFIAQRPVIQAGMRYKILEPLAVKGTLSFGMISAHDKNAKDPYRLDRNLSFRSTLTEFAGQIEYSIIKEPASQRYSLRRGRKFSLRHIKVNTYLFAGIAGFYFNPKAKDIGEGGSGDWVALQPLGTEGQGLMEGREKYSRIQMSFPFGVGFKYNINRNIGVGLEFGARYTTTDYLDDVSSTYVDNAWLSASNPLAGRMADMSIQTNDGSDPLPNVTYGGGDQRGETKYNDFYMFSMVTIVYKLRTGRNGLPKF